MNKERVKELICVGGLAATVLSSGCMDLVTNPMKPGESRPLGKLEYNNDYTIKGCVIERNVVERIVMIEEGDLRVFAAADRNEEEAWSTYLGREAGLIGTVTEVSPRIGWIDVDIVDNKTAVCMLKDQMTHAEQQALVGKKVTFVGKIKDLSEFSVRLYDCEIETIWPE